MRTLIFLLVAIVPINLFSQIENVYGTYYMPERQYKFKNELYTSIKKSLEGDKLEIYGLTDYPMALYIATSSEILASTGSAKKDTVPIKFSFLKESIKTTLNDRTFIEKNPCKGISIEGDWNNNRFFLKPKNLDGLNISKKNYVLELLELSKTQILFPAIPLKIGDRFSWINATDILIFGLSPVHCIITSVFTLDDTVKNIARFTINQEIVQDSSKYNPLIELKGFGYGSVDYDTFERFLTKRIINETISAKYKTGKFDIIVDYNSSVNQEVKIKKNHGSTDIKLDNYSYYNPSKLTGY